MYLRKGNLKFVIAQNNRDKTLIVNQFRKAVDERRDGDYFAYDEEKLIGKDFRQLLPEDIKDIINENIDFSFDGTDLKSVLNHIITFKILLSDDTALDMNVHAENDISTEEEQIFELILERKYHLRDKVKHILASISQVQDAYHTGTNLLNQDTFLYTLDEVMDYLYEIKVESVLMVLSLEGFPLIRRNEGKEKTDELIKNVAGVIKTTFRSRDVPAYLGLGKFGVIMLRTFEDEVMYPLKRLESNMKLANLFKRRISLNARYEKLDLGLKARDMIEAVKNAQVKHTINKI